ncbi:hypothetical protein FDV58_27785 [Bradyrhizobium elkanii]|uniref:Uncharacterized protein n=1 Tax=Bradyrhizobium elkanii TaxID=29448 RepID=A0A4U6RSX1_BRAEL|nr:hypothetical protein [Bradyrhizobium elkanii]TKV78004.1 hypothetical protein FDV58_27785 [Bradyrhizobium elkanii]
MPGTKLVIASVMALVSLTSARAAEDLSSFGEPVVTNESVHADEQSSGPANKIWPRHVCAEIQRVEKIVSLNARPTDRGMTRIGLLMLEERHCGIDVGKKIAADQAVLGDEQRKARRDYEENIAAAQRAASQPPEPIIVQVPQATQTPGLPDPPPTVNCFTNRLGGGMSTTTCR